MSAQSTVDNKTPVASEAAAVAIPVTVARAAPSAPAKAKTRQPLTALLRKWHQRIGLTAAVFVLWLGASGTILSRSDQLGFDAMRLNWNWLTAWYGLNAEPPRMGFEAAGHWMAATKENTLLDAREVEPRIAPPIGLVTLHGPTGTQLVIGTADSLVITSPDGARVDELRAPILPVSSLRRIGRTTDGGIAVQDFDAYESRDGGISWTPVLPQSVSWSQPKPLPSEQRKAIEQFARPSVLVEQVLIDLHSGRLFGPIGAWIITLVGLLALLLSISGVWSWWRIKQSRKRAAHG
ncbi:MAG: PepSY domain-containing protein [Gammaproteobacteria bacterium]|nr:PepSY domain-containing protein [Gammaproteobacteria bacterium]